MPYKDPERQRAYQREYQRRYKKGKHRKRPGQHSRELRTVWSRPYTLVDEMRCMHHLFTSKPCRAKPKWLDVETASKWCERHKPTTGDLVPLAIVLP